MTERRAIACVIVFVGVVEALFFSLGACWAPGGFEPKAGDVSWRQAALDHELAETKWQAEAVGAAAQTQECIHVARAAETQATECMELLEACLPEVEREATVQSMPRAEQRVRTSIDLPLSLYREIKVEAARRGKTLKQLFVEAIENRHVLAPQEPRKR